MAASIFLHAGFLHIVLNGLALADLGRICEPLLGTQRFLTVYVTSGLLANAASLAYRHFWGWPRMEAVGSVGASGAIMGLIGLLLGFSLRHRDRELREQIVHSLIYLAIMSFVLSNIMDHAAHLGGLATGMVFGLFVPRYVTSDSIRRWNVPCWISIAICAAGLGVALWNQFRLRGG
jgi:membrane associated rhomboid family serine protease